VENYIGVISATLAHHNRYGPKKDAEQDLEVGAGPIGFLARRPTRADAAAASDLLELLAGGHLLGEECGLDAVKQALQPPDELSLGDAELGLRGC
jgi:hypothetical protein